MVQMFTVDSQGFLVFPVLSLAGKQPWRPMITFGPTVRRSMFPGCEPRLLSVSSDHTMRMWNIKTGRFGCGDHGDDVPVIDNYCNDYNL